MDDIFCVIKKNGDEDVLLAAHINSLQQSIKFTIELEEKGSPPFLDCHLHRTNANTISISV